MASFLRYIIAGSIAFATHLAILETLVRATSCHPWIASAVGFVVACTVNHSLQYAWVFRSGERHVAAAARYVSITLSMLVVNTGIFALLHSAIGLAPAAAQSVTTSGVFLLNYFCNRRFTFAVANVSATGATTR